MPAGRLAPACCDRCPSAGTDVKPGQAHADRAARTAAVTRRRLLKAAVFPARVSPPADTAADDAAVAEIARPDAEAWRLSADPSGVGFADMGMLPRAVSGTVLDISPQVLVLGDERDEQRFTLTPDAVAWRGGHLEPAALRPGDQVVVRLKPSSRHTADRIWANIGRVTGIITERSGGMLVVAESATRRPRVVCVQPRAMGRIQVRFPTLEPGYLIDVIGLRRGAELDALIPATSQPAYPASRLPRPPLVSGHVPDAISGSATWHEPGDEPPGVLGICYPALDPETGCAEDAISAQPHGYARMPFLALGSVLLIRNECASLQCVLPVTGCAPVARLFNDRCVTCGTSPRGRIADLTMASFIALGGELERGCFNATIRIGE
jgi:hypothetical protein